MLPESTDQAPSVKNSSPDDSAKISFPERLRRKWRPLTSAVLVLVGSAVAAGLTGSITDATRWLSKRSITVFHDAFPPSLPRADTAAPLSILVARLDGDEDGSQSERINFSLGDAFRLNDQNQQVEVLYTPQTLRLGDTGKLAADLSAAETRGRSWLKESGADVLIWGRVAQKDKVFRIYFLDKYSTPRSSNPHGTYSITPQLLLSTDFDRDLGVAIAGMATAIAAPAKQVGMSPVAADVLEGLYPRLRRLAELQASKASRASCDISFAAITGQRPKSVLPTR